MEVAKGVITVVDLLEDTSGMETTRDVSNTGMIGTIILKMIMVRAVAVILIIASIHMEEISITTTTKILAIKKGQASTINPMKTVTIKAKNHSIKNMAVAVITIDNKTRVNKVTDNKILIKEPMKRFLVKQETITQSKGLHILKDKNLP